MRRFFVIISLVFILILTVLPTFSAQQSISQYGDSLFIADSSQSYYYLNAHNNVYVDTPIPVYDTSEDEMREWIVQTPVLLPHIVNNGINYGYGNTQLTNQWKYVSSIYYHYDEVDTYNYTIAEIGSYGYSDTVLAENYRYYTYGVVPNNLSTHKVVITGICVFDQYDVPLVIDAPNYDIQVKATLNTYRLSDGQSLSVTEDIRTRQRLSLNKDTFNRHPVGGNDNMYWIEYSIICDPYPSTLSGDEVKISIPCDTDNEFNFNNPNIVAVDPVYRYLSINHNEGVGGIIVITENGSYNVRDASQVNVSVPQTISWGGMFDWIFDSVGAIMNFEIAPGWSLGVMFSILIAVGVALWALKTFSGG